MPKNIPSPSLPDKGRKRIMRIIIEDPVLSLTDISFLEKGILALAHSFTKNGSRLYLSDEDLAVPFSTHRMTVNRAVQNLVKLGYLEKRTEARTGGKSYRSLGSLVDEHSNKMHLCLNEVNESIATNCISHSNKMHLCSPSIATNCISHSNKLHHIIKSNLKDINLKEVKEIVAAAPTPTYEFPLTLGEPQDLEVPLESESVKEPIEVSEAPPLPAAPPKAKKAKQPERGWSDVQAAATPEQWESIEMWRKHRTQMKKPCTPLSIMQNLKKYGSDLSAAIEHSIEKGWQGIFSPSRNGTHGKEPLTAGLTDKEIDLRLDFIWAHYKDSPIIPVRPFKDLAEENFVIDVLRSIFGDDYEEAIKKRRTDEKSFYQSAFRNKYKQGVENTKV